MGSTCNVSVDLNQQIGKISPYLHGQFAEHLGELVYPGVWVGPESPIANVNGIRSDVIEALRPLALPVVRWPGGCFADGYHWRDGIGAQHTRPMRVNPWWGMQPEPNTFGTHEFIDFCHAIGSEPYITGNVGSGSPQELSDWVEYCNFRGDSNLTHERTLNGSVEPFNVKFWGVGNENWGCGGNMDPDTYAALFARFRTFMFDFPGAPLHAIACGASWHDWAWTESLFRYLKTKHSDRLNMMQSFAAHYYCGTAGTATQYTEDQWLELMARAIAVEGIIMGHRAIMDQFDPNRRISLIIDEWGTWHPVEAGKPSSGLFQQNTIRDACVAALTLDIFNNHADIVYMANIAQLINVLQALLLVQGDKCIKTPTYWVYDLYKPHRDATAVRFTSDAPVISDGGESAEFCSEQFVDKRIVRLQFIHGSASIKDNVLCVTLVNTHPCDAVEVNVAITGGVLGETNVVQLAAPDIHAHNTLEAPDNVSKSAPESTSMNGENIQISLAPASIVRMMGTIR